MLTSLSKLSSSNLAAPSLSTSTALRYITQILTSISTYQAVIPNVANNINTENPSPILPPTIAEGEDEKEPIPKQTPKTINPTVLFPDTINPLVHTDPPIMYLWHMSLVITQPTTSIQTATDGTPMAGGLFTSGIEEIASESRTVLMTASHVPYGRNLFRGRGPVTTHGVLALGESMLLSAAALAGRNAAMATIFSFS